MILISLKSPSITTVFKIDVSKTNLSAEYEYFGALFLSLKNWQKPTIFSKDLGSLADLIISKYLFFSSSVA